MRIAAFSTLLLVFLAGALFLLRPQDDSAPGPAPMDLEQAREVFVQGDVEASKALALRIAASEDAPVAWLLAGLRHEDRNVREWSAHILGDVAPPEDAVVAALMVSFEDEDDWVRWKSARALGNIGPSARAALPLLEQAAADVREEVVHAAALKAVRQIRAPE